ncbi:MAG: hypothetical protein IKU22_06610 [Alistipes sp.]|nr:hypothetical protein [Alistipes sp.]
MRRYIYIILLTLLASCREHIEPLSVAGYIVDTNNSNEIVLHILDSVPDVRRYAVDDNTLFSGGSVVEGNIAEVIYMPSDDESLPVAQSVTADATYPRFLGQWISDKSSALRIDILLEPRGRVVQNSPESTFRFEIWQLTGEENTITLHGTLSLPPQREVKEGKKDDPTLEIPTRQTKHFSVQARLAYDEEGNSAQHKVMIIRNDKGQESRLYPAWD